MNEELKLFEKEFERIKKLDYVKSSKNGPFGAMDTLEEYLKEKNDLSLHYFKIQIKNELTRDYINLFSLTPKGKSTQEVKRLKSTYGEVDPLLKKARTLNASIQANCCTLVSGRFLFKLDIDYDSEKVFLVIMDRNMFLLERKVYWDFKDLKEKLERKLKPFVLVKVWTKKIGKVDYYKFYDYDFYQLNDFPTFLKLLEDGTIRISFKVSIYRTGQRAGNMLDHGTSFEIQELDVEKLYTLQK